MVVINLLAPRKQALSYVPASIHLLCGFFFTELQPYLLAALLMESFSRAVWDVDAEDYDKLREALGGAVLPTWKQIKDKCRVYCKPREIMAQQLLRAAHQWSTATGMDGKTSVWTKEADAVVGRLLVEIAQGFYEGVKPCFC